MTRENEETHLVARAREGLRQAAEAVAEMGEAERLPADWLERLGRYREALDELLNAEFAR